MTPAASHQRDGVQQLAPDNLAGHQPRADPAVPRRARAIPCRTLGSSRQAMLTEGAGWHKPGPFTHPLLMHIEHAVVLSAAH